MRRTALAAPPLPRRSVLIRTLPAATRFSLRLPMNDAATRGEVAGYALDIAINRAVKNGACWSARLGPNEWLLGGPEGEEEAIAGSIEAAFAGAVHSLTDISHRQVAFEIAGSEATAVLNAGCPLDLSQATFPPGSATRTLLGKVEIILMRPAEPPTFRLEVWRSFAEYAYAFLVEAARDCRALA
jgi:sarcosine oxidase subunit gamma